MRDKPTAHRIDIEAEWDEFTRITALVDEVDADAFLAVLYCWRDECVTAALRGARPTPPAVDQDGGQR